mmetsp:Transcript_24974/g.78726  ORF Transcript_24974/g.78726 Transcript_24974/m.78726 type:complete len:287 (+) Transcript_24974:1151-2011(+)
MQLQATSTRFQDLLQASRVRRVALAREAEVQWQGVRGLQHHLHLAWRRCTSGGIGAGRWPRASAVHRGKAGGHRVLDLLRADEVHVHVQAARSGDELLPRDGLRVHTHDHAWRHALHDVGVARLADAYDAAALDANVGLDNAQLRIDDQRVGDDHVQGVCRADARRLAHALAQDLAATKLALVSVDREVLLHLGHKAGVPQPHPVAHGGPEEVCVMVAGQHQGLAWHLLGYFLVAKALVLDAPHDLRQPLRARHAVHQAVPGDHAPVACDLHQRDHLHVARLEAHR